ncbi:MAG: HPF/RaiA family ribosome-associated protein [Bryobacterales bacterium]|nr:HPF/RaiA family ribosome-associated protein [Bryobacterales bacterium]MBV9399348.1 HPF/RaiA family ribosome-associated protein [Bryobacterales bacterium]
MRVQLNSDKNIAIDARLTQFVKREVSNGLKAFTSRLTRVEVFLSDVNSHKPGVRDKRCLMEARPARHRPRVASSKAATVREAIKGAVAKLRSSLQTFYGRMTRTRSLIAPRRSTVKKRPIARKKAARSKRASHKLSPKS